MIIQTIDEPNILKDVIPEFDHSKYSQAEIIALHSFMETITQQNRGYAIAANQLGIHMNCFFCNVPNYIGLYFNPRIETPEDVEYIWIGESCLSIPNRFYSVSRPNTFKFKAKRLSRSIAYKYTFEDVEYDITPDPRNIIIRSVLCHETDTFMEY